MYVLDPEVRGWYSIETADDRASAPDAAVQEGARSRDGSPRAANDEIPQQLTHALAAGEDNQPSEDAP